VKIRRLCDIYCCIARVTHKPAEEYDVKKKDKTADDARETPEKTHPRDATAGGVRC